MKIYHDSKKLVTRRIYTIHLMNSEETWVLVSSGTQVQPQIILDPDYPPDNLSVSYDYGGSRVIYSYKSIIYNRSLAHRGFEQSFM